MPAGAMRASTFSRTSLRSGVASKPVTSIATSFVSPAPFWSMRPLTMITRSCTSRSRACTYTELNATTSHEPVTSSSPANTIGSPFFVVICLSEATMPPTMTISPSRRRSISLIAQSVLRRSWSRIGVSGWSET